MVGISGQGKFSAPPLLLLTMPKLSDLCKTFAAIAVAQPHSYSAKQAALSVSEHAMTILKRGDRGTQVKQLQEALRTAGWSDLNADGTFGRATDLAVREFQAREGIDVDGLAGPDTWRELGLDPPPPVLALALHPVYQARVDRARSVVNKGILYFIGHGGWNPKLPWPGKPGPVDGGKVGEGSDCSGYGAWVCGIKRGPLKAPWPTWFETSKLCHDARGKQAIVRRTDGPVVGGFVAYPDHGDKQGHIAVITGVSPLRGVDCSFSRSNRTGQAITERGLAFMANAHGSTYFVLATDP